MLFTAYPSVRTSAGQSPSRPEECDVTPANALAERPSHSGAVRLLSSHEDLEAAIRRAEQFERRNAEQLANRAQRHLAVLAGSVPPSELAAP
jgi:hypothetical protein